MNLRNLGIVFAPTLAIPAPLFTLLLAEFDVRFVSLLVASHGLILGSNYQLVFAVEKETGKSAPIMIDEPSSEGSLDQPRLRYPDGSQPPQRMRPNSELYESSGANILMEMEARGARLQGVFWGPDLFIVPTDLSVPCRASGGERNRVGRRRRR